MTDMSNLPRHHSNSFKTKPLQYEAYKSMLEYRHIPVTLLKKNSNLQDILW